MDFLTFMMELDISYYLVWKNKMQFMIGLDILQVGKVVLDIELVITSQVSVLIHIILYLYKKHWLFRML